MVKKGGILVNNTLITNRKGKFRQFGGIWDRLLISGIYLLLSIILSVILLPLINIVSSSFSSPKAVAAGRVSLFPVEFTLTGYQAVFTNELIQSGFLNSIIYTVLGTLMNVSLTLLAAYPLSRDGFVGHKLLIGFFTVTMFVSGGIVPSYLLMRDIGILYTRWAMIVPSGVSVYNMIIARTFMRTSIPADLYGAAEIDGCSDAGTFFRVVLPLVRPLIAVLILLFAVGHWNSYFGGLMYLRDENMFPLQLVLRKILILNQFDITKMNITMFEDLWDKQYFGELIKYSSIVVSTLPVMLLYPFIQKYFVKGVMLGSLKG